VHVSNVPSQVCHHLPRRQLLSQRAFDSSYTSISASGARYLADKTQVALVGIDYLSIGMYDEIGDAHRALLGKVRVKGLDQCGSMHMQFLCMEHVQVLNRVLYGCACHGHSAWCQCSHIQLG
jgi:hypothetical protein